MKLSDKIQRLRGQMNFLEFAKKTGVSRQTLANIEEGETVKLSTLKQIAKTCEVSEAVWLDMLVSWMRTEVGEEDFAKLSIQKFETAENEESTSEAENRLIHFFRLLTPEEQTQILKTVEPDRREIRNCLPPMNTVWERIDREQARYPEPGAIQSFAEDKTVSLDPATAAALRSSDRDDRAKDKYPPAKPQKRSTGARATKKP